MESDPHDGSDAQSATPWTSYEGSVATSRIAPRGRRAPKANEDRAQNGLSISQPMTYADVSRGIQRIFKERRDPMKISELEAAFEQRFGERIDSAAGISTRDYLLRKQNVFQFDEAQDTAYLQFNILAGPPIADPNSPKDECFVIDEFEKLIEDLGPVCYVSALCGKFIQRNGISVTSVTSTRPLDLLKRNPDRFLIVGGGNVSLVKFKDHPAVVSAMSQTTGKAARAARAAQDAQLPVPDIVTEQDVVQEFRRLILQDGSESVYISSLCGRFLQRFRRPVTHIINSRPADFLRKYPEIFELVGGGNVRLVQGPAAGVGQASISVEASTSQPRPVVAAALPVATAVPAMRPPGLGGESGSPVALLGDMHCPTLDEDLCQHLLQRIAPPGHNEALKRRASELCQLLQDRSFLNVEDTVLGGAVGKNLAYCGGGEEAEIVLLVDRLPDSDHDRWLPHILETLTAVLEMALGSKANGFRPCGGPVAEFMLCDGDRVGQPDLLVRLVVAPTLGPREVLLQQLRGTSNPELLNFMSPALARDAVELVARQPHNVLAAMRLMRWWVTQQAWPSVQDVPPPYLLELLVMNSALVPTTAGKPGQNRCIDGSKGPAKLVEATLDACARLPELRLLWEGTGMALFPASEVCATLLSQKPLVVDPVNPCINVANPTTFNATTLMARASLRTVRGRLSPFNSGRAVVHNLQ